jgi:hypothetical protein
MSHFFHRSIFELSAMSSCIGRPSILVFLVSFSPLASAQAIETKQHPCLTDLKVSKSQTMNEADASWYPIGLLIEPLATTELNKRRQAATAEWFQRTRSRTFYEKPKSKTDRYGRKALLPIMESNGNNHSLQDQLLEDGLARVDVRDLSPSCARHMLSIEKEARQFGIGLWAHEAYQVQKATSLHLSDKVSTYQLITGTILSITRNPKRISYLNFGNYWKEDFTVTLSARSLKIWEQQGHSLDELQGQTVYVRGWIENRDGALIRIKHPQQLQYEFKDQVREAR